MYIVMCEPGTSKNATCMSGRNTQSLFRERSRLGITTQSSDADKPSAKETHNKGHEIRSNRVEHLRETP